MKVSSNYLTGK